MHSACTLSITTHNILYFYPFLFPLLVSIFSSSSSFSFFFFLFSYSYSPIFSSYSLSFTSFFNHCIVIVAYITSTNSSSKKIIVCPCVISIFFINFVSISRSALSTFAHHPNLYQQHIPE